MKIPLLSTYRVRTVLLICFIGLTLFSGLTITLVSLRLSYTARFNYTQEVGHLLTQAVTHKVENFLQETEDVIESTERFSFKIEKGKVDFPLLLNNLAHRLIVNHNLGTAIYTEEKTGYALRLSLDEKLGFKYDTYGLSRFNQSSVYSEKDIIVEETIPNPSGTFTLKTYSYPDFPNKPLSVDENGGYDYRKRPFYFQGKAQSVLKKGEWTNCFTFLKNFKKIRTGLFYSTGLGDDNGELFAVLSIGISTEWISGYLNEVMQQIHKKGISSFIFEKLPDKSIKVLAHSLMADVFPKDEEGNTIYYALPKDMKDPAIEKMILSVPDSLLNGLKLQGDFEKLIYFDVDGSDYVGMIKTVLPGTSPDWYVSLYVPEKVLFSNAYWHFYLAIGILAAVMIISVVLSIILARSASKPIESLVLLAKKIGKLDFSHKVKADSNIIEIKNLAHSMSLMQIGLQAFTQYLPKDVLKSLFDAGTGAVPGGKEKDVAIMFADIANFTHYSESLDPNDLVLQLNEYLGCFSSVIIRNQGTVDKYIGDAVMAYWNAPRDCDDYVFKACKTAIQGLYNLSFLQKEWAKLNKPILKARVGINTGNVVLGNIGTEQHLSYTVIGDNVNLASRLEGLNKVYDTTIMISDVTLKACGDRLVTRPIDLVGVKGKDKKIMVHELLGLTNETSSKIVNFCSDFKTAFAAYVKKDWSVGLSLFQNLASENPDDKLSQIYVDRCTEYQQTPPDASWDGGYQYHEK
ncbi:MAG: adenylate/guanylate cyclase domain-containing protein [Gemmataceae bacterium]|nr:adenylate/guanylate cyclase domain-containing protein [Gemmataceae bacterium]